AGVCRYAETDLDPRRFQTCSQEFDDAAQFAADLGACEPANLAAKLVLLLEQRDIVAALGSGRSGLHPAGPAANHCHTPFLAGFLKCSATQLHFLAGSRVVDAGDRGVREYRFQTPIGAYTRSNGSFIPVLGFGRPIGICDQRPAESDIIAAPVDQILFGLFRTNDPTNADDWNVDSLFDAFCCFKLV